MGKKQNQQIEVDIPEIVHAYNCSDTCGVDKFDQMVSYYRILLNPKNGHCG